MTKPILTLRKSKPVDEADALVGKFAVARKQINTKAVRFTQIYDDPEDAKDEAIRLLAENKQGLYMVLKIVDTVGQ